MHCEGRAGGEGGGVLKETASAAMPRFHNSKVAAARLLMRIRLTVNVLLSAKQSS
jgi:hypothetical protein